MGTSYRLVTVDDVDAGLADAWETIRASNPAYASPYFAPEFTRLVAGERGDVRVVVIENDGRPVGFFPHQRSRFGHGRPVGGPLSDYHGIVAAPDSVWSVADVVRAAGLAVFTFDHLVDPAGRFAAHVGARAASPRIELEGGFAAYLQRLRGRPQDFVRKARKLEREVGPLTFTLHESDGDVLAQAIAWKRAQYRRTGITDAFAVPWTGRLLRRIMATQSAHVAGLCSVLRAGGKVVAVHAGMRSGRILHWWFPTYDPQFHKYSPGIILLFRIAEAMGTLGLDIIDLGKGNEPYKQAIATGATMLGEGFVERRSLLTAARSVRRWAEDHLPHHGLGASLRLPLRVYRRIEWMRQYH